MKRLAFLLLVSLLIAGCAAGRSTPTIATAEPIQVHRPLLAQLDGLPLDEFFAVSWRELSLRDPEGVLASGMADACGLEGAELNDISETYTRETYQMVATVLSALRTYDRDGLSPAQQISYDVYEWYLDDRLRSQEFTDYGYPVTYYPVTAAHMQLIYFFTDLHPVASREDAQDYVARLDQVDRKFEQLIDGLRRREAAGVVPPRFALEWALPELRGLANAGPMETPFYEAFRSKVAALPDATQAEKGDLLASAAAAIERSVLPAYRALVEAVEHLASAAPRDDGLWQFPDGDAYYRYTLRHYTTTEMTPGEIHELGLRELERIHPEMRLLFDELGYPEDEGLPALFDRVAQDGGTVPADQVFATYERLIREADAALDAAFDIRPEAEVVVVSSPIRGLYVSGSRDGSRPGAFHAGPGTESEQRYSMPTLAYHEAIPGHHLQIAVAQEADLPAFRNDIGFSAYSEGWAVYAEQLAGELGWYDDDPYGNLGRLQGEAYRAARLVVDTGLHAKRWSFDEAVDFFIENTGFDSGDSVEPAHAIARYIVLPGQATAYTIGMLEMLELRRGAMEELGDGFDIRDFHRVVLSNGSMPLEILEQVVQDYIDGRAATP
jgi:uncharacterized protein (DUF885 family)